MTNEQTLDTRAYAIVPGSVLLEMKRFMDRFFAKSKGSKEEVELRTAVRDLLSKVKAHVALVDWIEDEVSKVMAAHQPDPDAEWGQRDCEIAKDMKRVMRHVALKVLGERVEREEASAVSRLERIGMAIHEMYEDVKRDGALAVGVMHEDAIANEARAMVLGLLEARAEDAQLTVPVNLSAEAELAKMKACITDACECIENGSGLVLDVSDQPDVHRFKQLYAKLLMRLQELKRKAPAKACFDYGSPENRHEIGVFLSHVLPRVQNPNFVGDPELIDEILDGIALVGTGAAHATDAASAIGDDPQLPKAPIGSYRDIARQQVGPKYESITDALGMKARLVEVKEMLGADAAKDVIRLVGDATELSDIAPHKYMTVSTACDLVIAAYVTARGERAEKIAAQGPYFGGDAYKEQMRAPDVLQNRFFADVLKFNLAADRTMDVFNPRLIGLHTGFQLEELAEKLRAIAEALPQGGVHPCDSLPFVLLVGQMELIGAQFKQGVFDKAIDHANPVELLDGDIDSIIVAFGSMMSQGAALFPALHAVSESCLAKLVDGKAIHDSNGKIKKPEGWQKPNLIPHLHVSKQPGDMGEDLREHDADAARQVV